MSAWKGLLPELAKHSRVIAYSRAGLGKSEPGPLSRSPQAIVGELHQLLQALGERGPIVLVAHSLGGLFTRLYVSTFPAEVAGLVLVDGFHEAQFTWFARSSTALRIVSGRTGHAVMDEQPAVVVEAVRFVLAQVRSSKR